MSDAPKQVLPLLGLEFALAGTFPEPVHDPRRGLYVLATRGGLLGKALVPCFVGSALGTGGFAGEFQHNHPQFLLAAACSKPVHVYTCPLVDTDLVILSIERRLLRELRPAWNRQDESTAA